MVRIYHLGSKIVSMWGVWLFSNNRLFRIYPRTSKLLRWVRLRLLTNSNTRNRLCIRRSIRRSRWSRRSMGSSVCLLIPNIPRLLPLTKQNLQAQLVSSRVEDQTTIKRWFKCKRVWRWHRFRRSSFIIFSPTEADTGFIATKKYKEED